MKYTQAFAAYGARLKNTVWSMSAISDAGDLVVSLYENWITPDVDPGTWIYDDDIDSWKGLPHGGNEFRQNLNRALNGSLTVRLVLARPKTARDAEMVGNVQDERAIKKTFHVCQDITGRVESFDGSRLRLTFKGSMPDMTEILKPVKTIRASLNVWGAGPGMGGSSYIEFTPDVDALKVFGGDTATEGHEEIGSLPADAGWRKRVAFIVNEMPPAHEDHSPEDVRIRGARGLEAKLLAIAWSGPEGSEHVGTLLQLEDEELDKLLRCGALDGMACINAMNAVSETLDQDADQVLIALRQGLVADQFSWQYVEECASKVAAQADDELESELLARAEALKPFEDEISMLASAWRRISEHGSGFNYQMMMGAMRGSVRRFLEDYALEHGKLPSGKHQVPWNMMGKRGAFEIDLDAVRVEASKTS